VTVGFLVLLLLAVLSEWHMATPSTMAAKTAPIAS
jgi:hypothetical protein